ncbi:hypothetical protein CANINC_004792 [Pichia inconspicua]|uniref:Clathrin/coatomer adaptor adaptin-like N-terminal domain-containing protein n=1 Tax=Pichia inconspicua TaxID=52247 RepID=A0A4T0WV99_9ASCO|nr:hypothetical protein CANINC_004792 [[Candida] inconspicua]
MNDLQISRNLGAMFESAARHFTENGKSSVTLPPSVATFINTNYYHSKTVFTVQEMVKVLETSNEGEIYTVLKYIISTMFCGNEEELSKNGIMSVLYPHIMKKVTSNNIKIKRLVYAIIEAKSMEYQDETLLSINAIQKSLNDSNAIIRSLAIRCLSGIEIPAILPIVLLSLRKSVVDSSPLVRSASCIAILKCYKLDKRKDEEIRYQLSEYLELLLSDDDSKVLGTALTVYREVLYGNFDILHNKIEHILSHLDELEPTAFVDAVEVLRNYVELFISTNDASDDDDDDADAKYAARFVAQLERRVEFEYDIAAVVSAVHVIAELGAIGAHRDTRRVVSEATTFVPSLCDEPSVFVAKCRVYFALKWEWRVVAALLDVRSLDPVCMRALLEGVTAAVTRSGDSESRAALLETYTRRMGVGAGAGAGIIDAECVSGVRALVQENVSGHAGLLARLSKRVSESSGGTDTARASIVWLIGEFAMTDANGENSEASILRAALPDIVRSFVSRFKDEGPHTRLAILVCTTKILVMAISLAKNEACDANTILRSPLFKIYCYVQALASRDINVDIRDVSRALSSITPYVPYTGGESWSIEAALDTDSELRARCIEKCTNIDLALLLLQIEKRVGSVEKEDENDDTLSEAVRQFWNTIHNSPDEAYKEYYNELRNSGFVKKDYAVHGSRKENENFNGERNLARFAVSSPSASSSPVVEQIKTEIQQEIATAYAQALVNSITENCFEKCDGRGDNCITDCTTKFMRAWNSISRAYSARNAAKKREHVRPFVRAHVRPPPKVSQPKVQVQASPVEVPKWYQYINKKDFKVSDSMTEFLKRILSYSSFESIETMSYNRWTLLQREVVRYDNIVGPGGEGGIDVPSSIKDLIITARESNDSTSLVRVYDTFVHLLQRAASENEIGEHVDVDVDVNLNTAMDEFSTILTSGDVNDIFLSTLLRMKAEEIEQIWKSLDTTDIPAQLVHLIVSRSNFFSSSFITDIARIIGSSEEGARTTEEVELIISAVINNDKSTKLIEEIIESVPISLRTYERVLLENGPIKSIELFANEGYSLTNFASRSLMNRFANEGDIEKIIKLLEYHSIEHERPWFAEDWECAMRSLVKVGYREGAIDLLKTLIIIREGWYEQHNEEDEKIQDLSYILQDAELVSGIVFTSGKLIETLPSWNNGHLPLLITSKNKNEFEEIISIIGKPISSEDVKVRLLIGDKFGIEFNELQEKLAEAFNNLSLEEIDKLVLDRELLGVVVRIVEKCGKIESVEKEWGELLMLSESSDDTWQKMLNRAVHEATTDIDIVDTSSSGSCNNLEGARSRFRASKEVSGPLKALLAVARLSPRNRPQSPAIAREPWPQMAPIAPTWPQVAERPCDSSRIFPAAELWR